LEKLDFCYEKNMELDHFGKARMYSLQQLRNVFHALLSQS